MKDIITQTIQEATDEKKHIVKHEMTVDVESTKVVEAAIQAWGSELKNSRAAPSWSRIEPLIDEVDAHKAKLTVVTDQDGKGALLFSFGPEQTTALCEVKTLLVELATKVGADPALIAQAAATYDKAIENAQLSESYASDMGSLAAASFLEKTAVMNAVVHH